MKYIQKFNNKTNGITFRRWLMHCNPDYGLIEQLIGDGFKVEAEKLQDLIKYIDDKEVLQSYWILNIIKVKLKIS